MSSTKWREHTRQRVYNAWGAGLAVLLSIMAACRHNDATADAAVRSSATAPEPLAQAPSAPMEHPDATVPVPTVSASGTWSTMFGGGTGGGNSPVTLSVVQVGDQISGTYRPTPGGAPSVPGSISGTINGSTINGTWRDTSGSSGTMQLTLSPDGGSFAGSWTSSNLSGSWNGVRSSTTNEETPAPNEQPLPADAAPGTGNVHTEAESAPQYQDVTGTYSTRFQAGRHMLRTSVTLFQNSSLESIARIRAFQESAACARSPGRCVAGYYTYGDGSGSGTITGLFPETGGNEMIGSWNDNAGTGGIRFTFGINRRGRMEFDGVWYNAPLGSAGSRPVGAWRGTRAR